MSNVTLSDACVKALRSRPSAYDIRDVKLKGFGVRVLPSGAKRFFIHTQHRGTRVHWFDTYSRTAPDGANHALRILRQILEFAIARG